MKKLMSTIAAVLLIIGTNLAQDAAPEKQMHQGKHSKHQSMIDDIPDLTDQQKTQIKEIREESRKQMEPQRQEMKRLRAEMMELKSSESPDQNQINQLIDKQAGLKAEMEKTRTASELKIRALLTPEQQKAVDAKRKENMRVREKRMSEKRTIIKSE